MRRLWQQTRGGLAQRIDPSSLVFFRIVFGLTMLVEVLRYVLHDWIGAYYIRPDFHFKYSGFEWVEPWAGSGMYWHFAVLGVLAVCITIGAFYRIAMVLFTVGFSYVFLLDKTHYLNHFYLVILMSILLCFVPAQRAFSVDAWRHRRKTKAAWGDGCVPAWSLWLLLIQFEIMLLYAGIVKVNPDWLRLEPLGMWLNQRDDLPLIGPLFAREWVVAVGAYGVIALHLIGAPLLLWKRTRAVVFVCYALFHLSNHVVFEIGIFPWLTIAGTTLFFRPDWPRLAASWVIDRLAPLAGVTVSGTSDQSGSARSGTVSAWVPGLMTVWFAFQVGFPLRHHLYPGDVAWTEDGHRFAWRMKLRDKRGDASFTVRDPRNGQMWEVDQGDYLTRRQERKMRTRPDMILEFAHYLERDYQERFRVPDPEVRVDVTLSLNGRPRARLIHQGLDLTMVDPELLNVEWTLPLTEPLPEERVWAR